MAFKPGKKRPKLKGLNAPREVAENFKKKGMKSSDCSDASKFTKAMANASK